MVGKARVELAFIKDFFMKLTTTRPPAEYHTKLDHFPTLEKLGLISNMLKFTWEINFFNFTFPRNKKSST